MYMYPYVCLLRMITHGNAGDESCVGDDLADSPLVFQVKVTEHIWW